jgi:hypothetical protein
MSMKPAGKEECQPGLAHLCQKVKLGFLQQVLPPTKKVSNCSFVPQKLRQSKENMMKKATQKPEHALVLAHK